MKTKQQAGEFIGAFASYGYKKSPTNKNKLVIDEPAAEVVRRIFSMYLEGYGKRTIASCLNAEKTLHTDIADGIHVKGDSKCLYELVNILVDNAVKYCDDHGDIQVSLRRPRLGKGAVVAVTNTYADGANVDYSRFFERFYRGDTSHNSQKAGYGIGLSMAEELTKLMDGKINVSYKARVFSYQMGFPTAFPLQREIFPLCFRSLFPHASIRAVFHSREYFEGSDKASTRKWCHS